MSHTAILDEIVGPRPNGSESFFQAAEFIQEWLQAKDVAVDTHSFLLRPYMLEIMGLTIVLLAVLCTYLAVKNKTLVAAFFPLVIAIVLVAEMVFHIPVLSGLYQINASNLVVEFHPAEMQRELILSAHYDSKTQPLHHYYRNFVIGMSGVAAAAWVVVTSLRWRAFTQQSSATRAQDVLQRVTIYLILLYWLSVGFAVGGGVLLEPSPGAVDNAGSVAVLMVLAEDLAAADLQETGVTLVFTAGEELNMQGSRAYVNDRMAAGISHPVYNINLEFIAQEGNYMHWRKDGNFMRQIDTCNLLNEVLEAAVGEVTGKGLHPMPADFLGFSDSGSFLMAGIPSTTFSNAGCDVLGTRYMHTRLDNRDRLIEERIPQAVEILKEIIFSSGDLDSR